jgi:predicted nucleic acid-binding protein
LILDTNFIIATQREFSHGIAGPATAFLAARDGQEFAITFTIAGELACGRSAAERRIWQGLCRPYLLLDWSIEISWKYGELYRLLQARGELIGTNDLWIAASALFYDRELVTNNAREFTRVPGLQVITY